VVSFIGCGSRSMRGKAPRSDLIKYAVLITNTVSPLFTIID